MDRAADDRANGEEFAVGQAEMGEQLLPLGHDDAVLRHHIEIGPAGVEQAQPRVDAIRIKLADNMRGHPLGAPADPVGQQQHDAQGAASGQVRRGWGVHNIPSSRPGGAFASPSRGRQGPERMWEYSLLQDELPGARIRSIQPAVSNFGSVL